MRRPLRSITPASVPQITLAPGQLQRFPYRARASAYLPSSGTGLYANPDARFRSCSRRMFANGSRAGSSSDTPGSGTTE